MTNEEYINYFNKIYYGIQHCTYPVHPVITEHFLKKEDYAVKSLLKFCELRPKIINFTDIKPPTRTIDLRKSIENK